MLNRNQLFAKYPYIVAMGKMYGSDGWYVEKECALAHHENAPTDAIYKDSEGKWVVANAGWKEKLDPYKNGTKGGMLHHF